MTSIVILTYNQVTFTKQCVDSIFRSTVEPYELIFVDNGSDDSTVTYLQSLSDIATSSTLEQVQVICNETNFGYAAGCNQGIKAAVGEQIVLLNNDVIVPRFWLQRLLTAFPRNPKIGLVGPCTNYTAGMQCVCVEYEGTDGLDAFSEKWAARHSGIVEEVNLLMGFCLLLKRQVIEQTGLLDEQFGLGSYEDVDFCHQAIRSGWQLMIAKEAFVHHFGHRTFCGSSIDTEQLRHRNEKLFFYQKWPDLAHNRGAASK